MGGGTRYNPDRAARRGDRNRRPERIGQVHGLRRDDGILALLRRGIRDREPRENGRAARGTDTGCTPRFYVTAIEMVRVGVQGATAGDRPELPMQAQARASLAHYADRALHELSGGEARWVIFVHVRAQAWTPVEDSTPRWLLLDESVSSFDIVHQVQVMEIARTFARTGGGMVAVTHDLKLITLYADRVWP
jgi:ABC-type hemin transport system ATPase subunit